MLKIVLMAESKAAGQKIIATLPAQLRTTICAIAVPDTLSQELIAQEADLVLMPTALAPKINFVATSKVQPRTTITASTHQGIQLVPVAEVFYFQAEHKYVTAYHAHGQLLIDDSLNSLEKEFATTFVRIHRNTLVAIAKIEQLQRKDYGKFCIKLHGVDKELAVSRRQIPAVRKAVLCL